MDLRADTADLRSDAYREASSFDLPTGWAADRPPVNGITIDGEHSRDRDDAIWLVPEHSGYRVWVSIADIGSFVSASSALARDAEQRGETRYLRTTNIPMLPPTISEGVLSLLETQETPTLSLQLSLSSLGEITAVRFAFGRLRPRRLTYRGVTRAIMGAADTGEGRLLRGYERLALELLAHRQSQGAFAFYEPDVGLMTDEEGRLVRLRGGRRHAGKFIVQEFMILANTAVAEYLWRNEVPALFRNHRLALDNIGLEQAVDIMLSGSTEQIAVLRQGFGRARYETSPHGHAGLALDAYTHWTSPLRRFADFVNHQNLAAHLRGGELPYSRQRLDEIARHLDHLQDQLRTNKAAHFKEIAQAATARGLTRPSQELEALDGEHFYAIVKMAGKTGVAPRGLSIAIAQRTAAGALGPRELTRLLFAARDDDESWVQINRAVVAHLQNCPPDGVTVLNYAQQLGLIDAVAYDFEQADAGFHCWTTLTLRGGSQLTAQEHGRSKRDAQQRAAYAIAARVANVEAMPPSPATAAGRGQTDAGGANPKGVLQEFLQRQGERLPAYETTEDTAAGAEHQFVSTVRLHVGVAPVWWTVLDLAS